MTRRVLYRVPDRRPLAASERDRLAALAESLPGLTRAQHAVAAALAARTTADGSAFVKGRDLAAAARCTVSTVRAAVSRLEALGFLEVSQYMRPAGAGQGANVYRLLVGANHKGANHKGTNHKGANPDKGANHKGADSWRPIPGFGTNQEQTFHSNPHEPREFRELIAAWPDMSGKGRAECLEGYTENPSGFERVARWGKTRNVGAGAIITAVRNGWHLGRGAPNGRPGEGSALRERDRAAVPEPLGTEAGVRLAQQLASQYAAEGASKGSLLDEFASRGYGPEAVAAGLEHFRALRAALREERSL